MRSTFNYATTLNKTPQSSPQVGVTNQVKNNAGGYTYAIDKWSQLKRFLILGSCDNTYYQNATALTVSNAKVIVDLIKENGLRVLTETESISQAGTAVKNDPAIFVWALAIKFGDEATRQYAYKNLNQVCRIGTHLFMFTEYLKQLDKGWSRGLKSAVGNWYLNQRNLGLQLAKYQQRNGWSNRDLLRLSHPKTTNQPLNALLKWAVKGHSDDDADIYPPMINAIKCIKENLVSDTHKLKLISEHNIPRECLPTEMLNQVDTWLALLPSMGMTALIRNLGTMSKLGVLNPLSQGEKLAVNKLTSETEIKNAKVHPMTILMALKTYSSGRGLLSTAMWSVNKNIVSALQTAFYSSFKYVEPTGLNYYIGLDVSGSMSGGTVGGINMTPREATAAIAMSLIRTEPWTYIAGFTGKMVPLTDFTKTASLDAICNSISRLPFGRTDCSLPMLDAIQKKMDVDVFVIMTDNETWCGTVHPMQALKEYRRVMNKPNAKLVILSTTPTKFSIADPADAGCLDIPGFSSDVPAVISEFSKL